ncbi:hypothetical protein [Rathayibacter iranicus]|uniref:Uncharacterized protein n=2 Tax=Rathayibacter iranicus TaxID=59737 RepID=A0AAD2PTV3_9MICO|nr:hypothetical protein [Rathayibacter iranicus]AZZ54994.1 hypothetical protein C7V51_03155 [Rathayibacter iranicus]MWV32280.1 hypothetical protein [Rathayibacter iranicus NCPPB 2253 = VKM Ac-1602]PPI62378.1 hypothetical protein C5E08_03160 [Rathayibacter iranicus]PWJ61102.1 hypothetical protein B0H03_12040 [Rathayibacter iranicus NCPPB 2253 = VKM Ac-1602]
MEKINLAAGWEALWRTITSNTTGLNEALTVIGVVVLLVGVIPWAWQKRKGGGGGGALSGFPWWSVIIAAVFAGPVVVIPLILNLVSVIINVSISVFSFLIGVIK